MSAGVGIPKRFSGHFFCGIVFTLSIGSEVGLDSTDYVSRGWFRILNFRCTYVVLKCARILVQVGLLLVYGFIECPEFCLGFVSESYRR